MKETKIEIPAGCEVEKTEIMDGALVVTFKKKERALPKSFDEFCETFPVQRGECYVSSSSEINEVSTKRYRLDEDSNLLPDRATAEAVLALCQLIQLRNAYNGDWVPDWKEGGESKYCVGLDFGDMYTKTNCVTPSLLFFKSKELRDDFLHYFRHLIEKLKPLYGIAL